MTPDELAVEILRLVNEAERAIDDEHADRQLLLEHLIRDIRRVFKPERRAKVVLFKASGKYYTEEDWRVPREVRDYSPQRGGFTREAINPWDMRQSPDFRRIGNGAVLVVGGDMDWPPHLFPAES